MGNRHLFIVVDKASKFMSTYLLESKEAECAARNLLGLAPTFGVLLSLIATQGLSSSRRRSPISADGFT